MLREGGVRFLISLNKVDRLYGWKSIPNRNIREAFAEQDTNTLSEFNSRLERITVQIMELGLNARLYWENDSIDDTISICPTSAVTGEGIGDLIYNIINYSQEYLSDEITWVNELKCIVMESTVTEGFGHTIDTILINGELSIGDRIIVSTSDGPIETVIRNILTPPPNRESRIKSEYIHHKTIKGAIGIKIVANNISKLWLEHLFLL
jgi:translation initiation factor 5B